MNTEQKLFDKEMLDAAVLNLLQNSDIRVETDSPDYRKLAEWLERTLRIDRVKQSEWRKQCARDFLDKTEGEMFSRLKEHHDRHRQLVALNMESLSPVRPAAEVYHGWGYMDGILYGYVNVLGTDEIKKRRTAWKERCDEAFGADIGQTLRMQQ